MTDDAERKHTKRVQELKTIVDNTDAEWPMQLEIVRLQARFMRAKYDALLAQKFTPEQALDLCWRLP